MIKAILKVFKTIGQVLLATVVFLCVCELLFRLLGLPGGTSDFAESVLMKEHLRAYKPKNEFRIFAYGESTIHGCHYAPVSSPPRWLEFYLKDLLPGKKIRVINFGRLGKGSDFALTTLRDTYEYHPDLAIFYLGHNDYNERHRKTTVEAERKTAGYQFKELIKKSHFLSFFWRQAIRAKIKRKAKKYEDQVGYDLIETPVCSGMGEELAVPRNNPFFKENAEFFKGNILDIVRFGEKHKLPMIFFTPVSNLKDFAPNFSEHLRPLSPEELSEWQSLYDEGKAAQDRGDVVRALPLLEQAYAIDDSYAELAFRIGQLYFRQGELAKAKRFFERGRDFDAIICRAPREIIDIIQDLPRSPGLDVIDTEKVVAAELPGGILGEPMIEDNVHFSVRGHALLGRALAEKIAEHDWIAPKSAWQWDREKPYAVMYREIGVNDPILFAADLKMIHFLGPRFENRIRFAERAIKKFPDDPRGYRSLAWTYWLMGDKDKAIEVYRKLEKIHPESLQEVFQEQPAVKKAYEKSAAATKAA